MSFPDNSYQPGNPPVENPPAGYPPYSYPSYPGQAGNGFNEQYPYPPAGYPGGSGYPAGAQYPAGSGYPSGMPQPPQGTDLSWLLNSVKQNRIWFIPFAMFFILVGYIVLAISKLDSPAATCTGLLFLTLGQALLVAYILATTKQVGGFTSVAAWVATMVITIGWLCVLINIVLGVSRNGSYFPMVILIFSILFVLVMIGGIIAGTVLSSKPTEPTSPAPALLISLFLLLAATTTPVVHAVGMILLITAVACSVIKPRQAYFVLLGVTAVLGLTNFIIGLASPAASCFLGLNRDYHGTSLVGSLFGAELENVGWIYWIIGGLTWVFSLVVLAACILAIYQTISRQPVTDLTVVFRNQSRANQYPGYYQQGQYPNYPYPQQPYYGGQVAPVPPNGSGQQFSQYQPPQQQSFMPPNPPQSPQPPVNS